MRRSKPDCIPACVLKHKSLDCVTAKKCQTGLLFAFILKIEIQSSLDWLPSHSYANYTYMSFDDLRAFMDITYDALWTKLWKEGLLHTAILHHYKTVTKLFFFLFFYHEKCRLWLTDWIPAVLAVTKIVVNTKLGVVKHKIIRSSITYMYFQAKWQVCNLNLSKCFSEFINLFAEI